MKLKKLFVLLLVLNILALIAVVLIVDEYQSATKKLQDAYEMQHKSLILADELRQSSDDLTRMARTYVVTGKDMFEDQFHMVLDIRNAVVPRPTNYNRIYWDFLTLKNEPILDGEKKSLRTLMKEAGFPEEELELLFQSAQESDDLTHLETKAMNAVKGIFQDENGNYTLKGEPDLKLAASIMHGDEYHRAKIAIMKPLDKFYQAFETRTQESVNEANYNVEKLGKYVSGAIFLLIILMLFSFFILLSRIIYPLESLKNSMLQLSNNDMETKIPNYTSSDEVGDMVGAVKIFKDNAIKLIQKEEKLKNAIKDAKAANHSKSIFLANMSHELRTPLNAILGFTSLLKKSINVSKQEKENLTVIQSSGNHLLSIINEILELSKIEVGKLDIVNSEFDFYDMIQEIKVMFESRCTAKAITLDIIVSDNVPQYISCDQQRLKQILINLIGNSLKFTPKGFIKCEVKAIKNKLAFSVEDSGIGISAKYKETIFKPFEQINTNKFTKNGTGLGLAITKELVKLMGGSIKLKSVVDKGSVFSFTISYGKVENPTIELSKKEQLLPKINLEKNITILVADDIEENRDLLVQILQQYGIKTIEASNGVEVLELLKTEKIDMIFLDILMPVLNGYETMQQIKKLNKYKEIPIVVVSANVFAEDKQKALSLGANSFLSKPINDSDVVKILEDILKIQFEYEQQNTEEITDNIALPKEFLEQLYSAVKLLDGNKIAALTEEYNLPNTLKEDILNKVKEFRFDEIVV